MKMVNVKTLMYEINSKTNYEFIIKLEGIITAEIKVKNLKIEEEKDFLSFLDKDNNEIIKVLKYQIMKIEKKKKNIQ